MDLAHVIVELHNSQQTLLSDDGNNIYHNVDLRIQNIDEEANVYIGVDGVSSSSFGILLYPRNTTTFSKLAEGDKIYAVSDTSGSKVAVFRSSSVSKNVD